MQDLSAPQAQVARVIAARLARRGHRAWIVGGAVRDLALARETHDVDLASAATPDEIEAEFERTIPLGRSFGTVLVHLDGLDVEHTTFRSEEGYSDARRPDSVAFGRTPEEDATRRDFTCNALYLDPLDGTVLDPTGGIEDLENGRLACVGEPGRRFTEDGLRIVRMARFAGQLGLEPTAATRAAATRSLEALRGVSRERVRIELERLLERGGLVRAVRVMAETGALERVLPGLEDAGLEEDGAEAAALERRLDLLGRIPQHPGVRLGFAALLGPGDGPAGADADLERRTALLESLKPARALRDHVADVWRLEREMAGSPDPARSVRVRWMRRGAFADALALLRARAEQAGAGLALFDELRRERDDLAAIGFERHAFVTSADLSARGIRPGPAYGAILHEAETLQLDGELATRDEALRWLDARIAQRASAGDAAQDGGNTRRNA